MAVPGLYTSENFLRIVLACFDVAKNKGDQLVPSDFNQYDLMHYLGFDTLDYYCTNHLSPGDRLIDIGSGAGGSSRHIAWKYNCNVDSVEILEELAKVSDGLNFLLKLQSVNTHIGDFVSLSGGNPDWETSFNAAVSQLAILHIPNKKKVFEQVNHILKPGGTLFIEDFFVNDGQTLTQAELDALSNDISVRLDGMLTKSEYIALLEQVGFEIVEWNDQTVDWIHFVWDRLETFLESRKDHSQPIDQLGWFYLQMAFLFHEAEPAFYENHPRTLESILKAHDNQHPSSCPQALGGVSFIARKTT